MMKRIAALLIGLAALTFGLPAQAQQGQVVASTCPVTRSTPYSIGFNAPLALDQNGNVCTSGGGSVSGTVTANQGTANSTPWNVTNNPSAAAAAAAAYAPAALSQALAANQVIKGSPGNLYSFEVSADSTLSGAAWWVMIYDATSAPSDGAVTPAKCYAYPANTTSASYSFSIPVAFATGIVIGVSTSGCFTKTASTHAFISGDAK